MIQVQAGYYARQGWSEPKKCIREPFGACEAGASVNVVESWATLLVLGVVVLTGLGIKGFFYYNRMKQMMGARRNKEIGVESSRLLDDFFLGFGGGVSLVETKM